MKQYLASTEFIDWKSREVLAKAQSLSQNGDSSEGIIKNCFEFVRDEIKHSGDYKLNPVTCKASDVLKHRTGYCFAKSHLLAALLRANEIPTGLCYQRLIVDANSTYGLHGLNAVHLKSVGWYRMDARGNKQGVTAEFCPPIEKLAFPMMSQGEYLLPEILSEPLNIVTQALRKNRSYQEVAEKLPDLKIIPDQPHQKRDV